MAGLRAHFADVDKGIAERNRVKLLFLGDGCAGKSTLYNHLRLGCPPPPIHPDERTHGIALSEWAADVPGIDVQVWDFGGQEIFHSTHRLFLGEGAVYVLVWTKQENKKCTEGEQHPLHYWLDFIADYGKNSTVLLVENVIDGQFDSREFPDDTRLEALIETYAERGITLVPTHHRFDCLHDTESVLDFKAALQRRLRTLAQKKPSGDVPANRYAVETALGTLRQTQRTCSLGDFEALCQRHDITNPTAFLSLLHDSGVVGYYAGLFGDQIVLQLDWLLDAVYALLKLTDNPLARLHGKLTNADIADIWAKQGYTPNEQWLFRDYMLKSELITDPFERHRYWSRSDLQRTYDYLVPALFPQPRPHDRLPWDTFDGYVVVQFRFVYRAIIQRLQVRVLTYCHVEEEETFYQNRISFTDRRGNIAHVELVEDAKELRIRVDHADTLADILSELDRIYPLDRVELFTRKPGQPDQPLRDPLRHPDPTDDAPGFGFDKQPIPIKETMKEPIRIFVTYAWNDATDAFDATHQDRVLAFTKALHRYKNFDVRIDLVENQKQTATQFDRMMLSNMSDSDKVIVVLSEGYAKNADTFQRSIGGVEYPAIISHINAEPTKFCLVSFCPITTALFPYGLTNRHTVAILNGELESSDNETAKNDLFSKLLEEPTVELGPKSDDVAAVRKRLL